MAGATWHGIWSFSKRWLRQTSKDMEYEDSLISLSIWFYFFFFLFLVFRWRAHNRCAAWIQSCHTKMEWNDSMEKIKADMSSEPKTKQNKNKPREMIKLFRAQIWPNIICIYFLLRILSGKHTEVNSSK